MQNPQNLFKFYAFRNNLFLFLFSTANIFVAPGFAFADGARCEETLSPSIRLYHATARGNVATLKKYGFYGPLHWATFANDLSTRDVVRDPRFLEPGVVIVLDAPEFFIEMTPEGYYGLSDRAEVFEVPHADIYRFNEIRDLNQFATRRGRAGRLPERSINWLASIEITAKIYEEDLKVSSVEAHAMAEKALALKP